MKKQNIKTIGKIKQPEISQEIPIPTPKAKTAKPVVKVIPNNIIEELESSESNDSNNDLLKSNIVKQKRQPSAKQIENLQKGRERRDDKRRERIEENKRLEYERQKEIEEKIVKKAIQVKKRQIRQQKIIEPDSDDDYEDEPPPKPVLRRAATQRQYAPPRKPQIIYV